MDAVTDAGAEDARDVEDARFGVLLLALALAFSDGTAAAREGLRRLEAIRDAA